MLTLIHCAWAHSGKLFKPNERSLRKSQAFFGEPVRILNFLIKSSAKMKIEIHLKNEVIFKSESDTEINARQTLRRFFHLLSIHMQHIVFLIQGPDKGDGKVQAGH